MKARIEENGIQETNKNITPFFMTHHSPVGAWSSFTFGLPGKGVSIDHESPSVRNTADLLVAVSRGPGKVTAFPFLSGIVNADNEMIYSGDSNDFSIKKRWNFIPPSFMNRTLTSCIDEYSSGEITLRVYTPHCELPDPEQDQSLKYAACPGILMELTVDNSDCQEAAFGFIGLSCQDIAGRIRPLDWSSDESLCGVAFSGCWAMAARSIEGEVYTIRDNTIAQHVETGKKVVHNGGNEGGICFIVPPLSKTTLSAAFGFFHEGNATQGLKARYLFNRYFTSVEEVCGFILDNAQDIRKDCIEIDDKYSNLSDFSKYQAYCQALRAYFANTQLTEADDRVYYNVSEGMYLWRNTMDLAVDHLPFELRQNPWVVRNIMDLFIERYSYHDEVRFPEAPEKRFSGGLSFTHDMGSFSSYSPKGFSGYEMTDAEFYNYMTTEELLNGIYCIAAYAISTKDMEWIRKRADIARELLISMENRDHFDPAKRNGILKAESMRCGESGKEITTYDSLDHSIQNAVGSVYVAVKTMCAGVLLEEYFKLVNMDEYAMRAAAMSEKTQRSLGEFFDAQKGCFRANLYQETESMVIAAIEPFAVPIHLGLKDKFVENARLTELFQKHIRTCLKSGNCLEETYGGLKLSSTSANTWPSKVILCIYVMEELFGLNLQQEYPPIMKELLHWLQVSAAEKTISDQIFCDRRTVKGGSYYPRHITSSLWVW